MLLGCKVFNRPIKNVLLQKDGEDRMETEGKKKKLNTIVILFANRKILDQIGNYNKILNDTKTSLTIHYQ